MCDAIVLAAAGSTDASANADTARMAELLADLTGRTVVPSYLCAGTPTPQDAVDALRASGADHVALAGYLLGPGHFARKAAAAGATTAAEPLGAHPALADLVLARYDEALNHPLCAAAPARANEARPLPQRNYGDAMAANTTIQAPKETRDHLAQLAAERGMTIGQLVEAITADQPTSRPPRSAPNGSPRTARSPGA
ncbi:CbiX/SirB N-terminal domain-containing protein [Yinghuangia aomiensis]